MADNNVMGKRLKRMHPVIELTLSRVKEFIREPEALFWVFIFPVLLALALGIAFRDRPPDKMIVGVETGWPGAAETAKILEGSTALSIKNIDPSETDRSLAAGKVDLVVSGKTGADYDFEYDPTRSQGRIARLLTENALQAGRGRKNVVTVLDRPVTQPGSRYIDFLIPGLIGMNLLSSGMWGIGFNLVQARSRKLLKRLAATPMRRGHFLLAFMLSRLIFLYVEVALLIGFGWLIFDVQVRGSVIAVGLVTLLGAFTFAGMGVLVATRATSIEAVSGWINFVMLPMYILSGGFFSYERFPAVFHPFIRLLPLTAMIDALRSIMNDGASLFSNLPEMGVLALWCVVSFAVALKIFKWQ